jgi:hypothetical protein
MQKTYAKAIMSSCVEKKNTYTSDKPVTRHESYAFGTYANQKYFQNVYESQANATRQKDSYHTATQ